MAVESLGRLLVYIGIIIVVIGGFFLLMAKLPWFGRLPGDFDAQLGGTKVYIPLTTMILVSLVLTLLLNLVWRK